MRFGSIACFDLQAPDQPAVLLETGTEQTIDKLALSANGKALVAMTERHVFVRWPDWQHEAKPDSPLPNGVHSFAVAERGGKLAVQAPALNELRILESGTLSQHRYSPNAGINAGRESSLAMDESGTLLAGETPHGIRVYETATGDAVRRMHDDAVTDDDMVDGLLLSRDGRLMTAFDRNGFVRFFDVGSGRQLLRLPLGRHDFLAVAVDPQQRWVATSADQRIQLWDTIVPQVKVGFGSPADYIDDMQFSPDGQRIATTSTQGSRGYHHLSRLEIFAVKSARCLSKRIGGFESVNFSSNESCLAWQSNDTLIWSNLSGTTTWKAAPTAPLTLRHCVPLVGTVVPTDFQFVDAALAEDSTNAGTGASSNSDWPRVERIADSQAPAQQAWRIQMRGAPLRLKVHPTVAAQSDRHITTLLLSLKIEAEDSFEPPFSVTAVFPGRAGQVRQAAEWLQADADGSYQLFSLSYDFPPGPLSDFELRLDPSPRLRTVWLDQIHFIAIPWEGAAKINDLPDVSFAQRLAFAPAGNRLWGNVSNEVWSWSWPDGAVNSRWSNPLHYLTGAGNQRCLEPGASGVLAGTRDGFVHWLDAQQGTPLASWAGPGTEVVAAALCESSALAIAGGDNGVVAGYHLPDGGKVFELPAHNESVVALAATPDGSRLVTAAADRSLKLWQRNGSTYRLHCDLPGTSTSVRSLRLTADGRHLAILASKTRNLQIWHLDMLLEELQKLGIH
jgi:WD40 repeat protein